MQKITLNLVIWFDEIENINEEADVLKAAIQNRIFGEGIFNPNTMVETWSISTDCL